LLGAWKWVTCEREEITQGKDKRDRRRGGPRGEDKGIKEDLLVMPKEKLWGNLRGTRGSAASKKSKCTFTHRESGKKKGKEGIPKERANEEKGKLDHGQGCLVTQ